MLKARSVGEAYYYLRIHRCVCGETELPGHSTEIRDGDVVSVHEGPCPRCGTPRRYEFLVTGGALPHPAIGGDTPSRIICPGEFLAMSEHDVNAALTDLDRDSREQLTRARVLLERGIVGSEEVLKFVPPGETVVPESAFTSEYGRARRALEPDAFESALIEGVLRTLRAQLKGIDAELS